MTPEAAARIRLLALDVDGVLTDGHIVYGNDGEEFKAFHISDGLGIKLLQRAGVTVAIITGRRSAVVERRGSELGIDVVLQGREDKLVRPSANCARSAAWRSPSALIWAMTCPTLRQCARPAWA
jgi:3-deoxy-D-manno-octulosonate 8-phosphate phosphatase (KDO 8-P phosphatase)